MISKMKNNVVQLFPGNWSEHINQHERFIATYATTTGPEPKVKLRSATDYPETAEDEKLFDINELPLEQEDIPYLISSIAEVIKENVAKICTQIDSFNKKMDERDKETERLKKELKELKKGLKKYGL